MVCCLAFPQHSHWEPLASMPLPVFRDDLHRRRGAETSIWPHSPAAGPQARVDSDSILFPALCNTLEESKMQKPECFFAGTLDAPKWTGEYAKKYPFTLDPFQEVSIACIVRCSLTLKLL